MGDPNAMHDDAELPASTAACLARLAVHLSTNNAATSRRRKRHVDTVTFHAAWVDAYLHALAHDGRQPVKWLTQQPECSTVAGGAIRRYLASAEALGLVTGRTHGRAGGAMTKMCVDVLLGPGALPASAEHPSV